jgi:GDP-4-dehydro-6-deoxy-D-mannose reductase
MRALVTGGRGFAGAHLAQELTARGHDTIVLDRRDGFDVTDRDAVHHRFAALRPDVVYHLAALTHVGESWSAGHSVWRVNAEGTLNVLDAARDASVRRVVVVGSAEEYGRAADASPRIAEDAALRPQSPYAVSKVAADYLALQAWLGHGLETIRVRPFNHTGAGQSPRFVIPALAARVARAEREGTDAVVVGNLDAVRELLDVRDVARAYAALAELGAPGDVYNVCSGVGHRIGDVAERLLAMASRPLQLVVDPDLARPIDTPRLVGDPTKLAAATGWRAERPLDDTLQWVLDAARAAV